jgi:pilus assembly protein CpaB
MNRQTLLIIFGGFFTAVLVAVMIQLSLSSQKEEAVVAQEKAIETTQILVASANITKGDELKAEDMKWQEWPSEAIFTGAVEKQEDTKLSDALSGIAKRDFKKGEALTKDSVVPEKSENLMSALLSDGKRAVSITVNAASSVAGFAGPGDYVDIILTYDLRLPSDPDIKETANQVISRKSVQTVLQNVKVLAMDQDIKRADKAKVSKTVTIEVDLRQAEKLALAATMGKLSLALRRYGDEQIEQTSTDVAPAITDLRLSSVMQEMFDTSFANKNAPTKNNAGSKRRTMRIYNGNASSDVTIN